MTVSLYDNGFLSSVRKINFSPFGGDDFLLFALSFNVIFIRIRSKKISRTEVLQLLTPIDI